MSNRYVRRLCELSVLGVFSVLALGCEGEAPEPGALEAVTDWRTETTEGAMRNFAEQNYLKLGAVAQPLRVALTGRTTSPGIFDVLAVLGREECLARLADQAAS